VILPSLQKAKAVQLAPAITFASAALPKQQRDTKVVKDKPVDEIASEIVEWVTAG
jgi:electron transfer flavoprotein beta subunit